MLALHDKELYDVNPRAKNLSVETIARIAREVQVNPWYYFREIVVAPSKAGLKKIKFKANRFNISLYWNFFNHVTTMGIAIRQAGKSFAADALMSGLLSFWTFNTQINLLTKDVKLRVTNVERIKDIMKEYPPYLQLRTKKDSDNTENITVLRNNNILATAIGRMSEDDANKTFRGDSSPDNFVDEVGFIKNIHLALPAMLASGTAARDMAKDADAPYGTVLMTTAAKRTTKSGQFAWELYSNGAKWTELLYDLKNQEELHNVVRANSNGSPLMVLEFDHKQLGFTDQWLKEAMEAARANGEDAEADFLNIWGNGDSSSPLPKETLDKIVASITEPLHTEISETGYMLRWYISKETMMSYMKNRPLVMGIDTSDAVGNDGIGLVITDAITGETIAVGDYNETNLISFSEYVSELLFHFNKMVLIMERRSSGSAILDNITLWLRKRGIDPFKRIFNWVVDEAEAKPKRFESLKVPMQRRPHGMYDILRKELGFATSSSGRSSRDKLYGAGLLACTKYTGSTIRDRKLAHQLTGLVTKNGRIDHSSGNHDDLAIAKMLTWWFLTSAKNISFYGIKEDLPLSGVKMYKSVKVSEKTREKELSLREELDALIEQLEKSPDWGGSLILKARIDFLKKKLHDVNTGGLNIKRALETA